MMKGYLEGYVHKLFIHYILSTVDIIYCKYIYVSNAYIIFFCGRGSEQDQYEINAERPTKRPTDSKLLTKQAWETDCLWFGKGLRRPSVGRSVGWLSRPKYY